MAINPYPNVPISRGGTDLQLYATHASIKAVYSSENAIVSSVITLTADTTTLEIAAVGAPAVMRFVRVGDGTGAATSVISAVAGANVDHVIPKDTVLKIAVPIEVVYQAPSSMVGANIQNGLYRRAAIKSIGIASIMFSEF